MPYNGQKNGSYNLQNTSPINPSHSEGEGKAEQQGYPLKMPSKRNQKATKIIIGNFNAISRCPV
jgi:hypothetical protein